MSVTGVVTATAIVGGVGLFIGLFLGLAAIKFKVEVDEKEEAVLGALPGNNCGVFRVVPVWLRLSRRAKRRSMPVRWAASRWER